MCAALCVQQFEDSMESQALVSSFKYLLLIKYIQNRERYKRVTNSYDLGITNTNYEIWSM